MSLREIDIAQAQINKRRHNNIALKARFHGVEIPMITVDEAVEAFSEEKDKLLDEAMKSAMSRIAQERDVKR